MNQENKTEPPTQMTNSTGMINPKHILEEGIVVAVNGYPDIQLEGAENQLQQVGIDLRLAKAYRVVGPAILALAKQNSIKPELVEMTLSDGFYFFEAGKQYSLDFMEDVEVPDNMAALIINRSTINRTIGTVTSGIYDPGFRSGGPCGAVFRPNTSVRIQVGYRMAQIVFFSASAASQYDGQYQAPKETK